MGNSLDRLGLAFAVVALFGAIACDSHDNQDQPKGSEAGVGGASVGKSGTSPAAGIAGAATGTGATAPKGGNASTGAAGAAGASSTVGVAGSGTDMGPYDASWFATNSVSKRVSLSVPGASTILSAEKIGSQLKSYDPGSLIRCAVNEDAAYRVAVDAIGGVTWGYQVSILEDQSKPLIQAGFPELRKYATSNADMAGAASAVEIEEADIVGISDSSALFYSAEHGLFLVDLSGATPAFDCATKLPGRVSKFFFYRGHLVVMTENHSYGADKRSYLMHFAVTDGALRFVESVDLGRGGILDTRRFNDKLVVYTDLTLEAPTTSTSDAAGAYRYPATGLHRTLRVFAFGDKLTEQMNQTLLDTTPDQAFLTSGGIPADTAPGTLVSESSSFGRSMWASDHYFVVTEGLTKTHLSSWETRNYSVCTKSHTVEEPYRYCNTIYETRPNPNYTPPDNSGGDRACKGVTLADCLRTVSRASNPTIQVPVGTKCEDRVRNRWICDAYESRSHTYPQLKSTSFTRLYIFEYTDKGFVRLESQVREIATQGLDTKALSDVVPTLTTSSETFDLAVPGSVQTLQFQNGYLYAIADGILQVYAMGDSSLVRTTSLKVVNSGLQTSLFSNDKLYLSDFGYSGATDRSVLRVIDLTNAAFPRQLSDDRSLPGGHSNILPTSRGILTIGSVANFAPDIKSVLKLGLFTDPFASELAYLILGTDLGRNYLGDKKSHYFNATAERLFLPYYGLARDTNKFVARVGISHLETDSVVSEGAVELPEVPLRVRPSPASATDVLSFSSGAVEWLRPVTDGWSATPLLEYFKPIALYRISDKDDYTEVLRLGNRCQLHLSAASSINTRPEGSLSAPFDCGTAMPWAYDHNIIFSASSGVRFTDVGETTLLTTDEITGLIALQKARTICLLSQTRVSNTTVDFSTTHDLSGLTCYTPEAYQAALAALPSQ